MSSENESKNNEHTSNSHHHRSSHHHSSYSQPYGYGVSPRSRRHGKFKKSHAVISHKKKRSMRKSNKFALIIAIIVCVLILLSITVYEVYHAFILPKYVAPVLEDVVTVMQDEKYTYGITKEIQRLYDIGQISGPEVEKYLEIHTNKEDTQSASASEENMSASEEQQPSAPQSDSGDSSTLGINSVKIIDENSSQGSDKVHYYSSNNKTGSQDSKPDNTVSMSELQTLSSDEIYAKAKSIMSAEDFAAAMSLRSKISVSKVKELRSDTNALMQYLKTTLTSDEYSNMLYIYAKYSNHLTN